MKGQLEAKPQALELLKELTQGALRSGGRLVQEVESQALVREKR